MVFEWDVKLGPVVGYHTLTGRGEKQMEDGRGREGTDILLSNKRQHLRRSKDKWNVGDFDDWGKKTVAACSIHTLHSHNVLPLFMQYFIIHYSAMLHT